MVSADAVSIYDRHILALVATDVVAAAWAAVVAVAVVVDAAVTLRTFVVVSGALLLGLTRSDSVDISRIVFKGGCVGVDV